MPYLQNIFQIFGEYIFAIFRDIPVDKSKTVRDFNVTKSSIVCIIVDVHEFYEL